MKGFKQYVKEDYEQLDELSLRKLDDYIDKNFANRSELAAKLSKVKTKSDWDKIIKTLHKRQKGGDAASKHWDKAWKQSLKKPEDFFGDLRLSPNNTR